MEALKFPMEAIWVTGKGLSVNVDFVFHYLLLELNVSIAGRYVGGGWGKQVEFLQIPAPDANLLLWLRHPFLFQTNP